MSQKKLLDLITVNENLIDELDNPDAKHAIEELADKLVPLEDEIAKEPYAAITILPGGWVIVNGFTNLPLAMSVRTIAKACGLEKLLPRAINM
jgi:hypothetical protein